MRNAIAKAVCLLGVASEALAATSVPNGTYPYQVFKSSNATAPKLQIHKSGKALASGLLVLEPEQYYPSALLMQDDGDLVWCGPVERGTLFAVQTLFGKSVLVRWVGYTVKGLGYGAVKILDHTYKEIYNICPKLGLYAPNAAPQPACEADSHELQLSYRNTLVVSANNVTKADLTSVGGPKNGWVIDGQFYDLDLKTGKPIFGWSAIKHIPVSKTTSILNGTGATPPNAFDYFHINSVQPLHQGKYLVNGRYTSAMYLIKPDGSIEWEFNGYNGGDFDLAPDAKFAFQHDPRLMPAACTFTTDPKGRTDCATGGSQDCWILHFFNNDNSEVRSGVNQSTGLTFHLNPSTGKATLFRKIYDPNDPFYAVAQGGVQKLANGNVLVDYGVEPVFKEFGPTGFDVRMTVLFANTTSNGTYRAYRSGWSGEPYYPPSLHVDRKSRQAYMSWNGATDVTNWRLYAGKTKHRLRPIARFPKRGFETTHALPETSKGDKYFQVLALQHATKLRRSAVVKAH